MASVYTITELTAGLSSGIYEVSTSDGAIVATS